MSSASDFSSELPVLHVADVDAQAEGRKWLVRSLWSVGVGVLGALPKSYKTWLATELAYAVATGRKALGQFEVEQPGPVLVFQAEDDAPSMRNRFEGIAKVRGGRLREMPIFFVDVPALHLDDSEQLKALRHTVARAHPRLLVLDPWVRLVRHSDENSAAEVSAVLGGLREIQRSCDVAILLVHHMRKATSSNLGQQLRGSGDFSAWSDSAIYITRQGDDRLLTIEHRAAPPPPPFLVRLVQTPAPHLVLVDPENAGQSTPDPLGQAVLERLRLVGRPQSTLALRNALKVRKATLGAVLDSLARAGHVERTPEGWTLARRAGSTT